MPRNRAEPRRIDLGGPRVRQPGRNIDPTLRTAIRELCSGSDEQPSAGAILTALRAQFPRRTNDLPSLNTIRAICKSTTRGERWSLLDDTVSPEEAAAVLPVVAAMVEATGGRRTYLSKPEARLVARIHAASPGIPPAEAYRVMRQLLWAKGSPADEAMQMHYLAFRAWDPDGAKRYARAPLPLRYETEADLDSPASSGEGDER